MSTAAFEYSARLEAALDRRGNPLTVQALLDIVQEASTSSSEALSAGERSFLLEHTDLTEDDLTPSTRAATQLAVVRDRADAEQQARESALTTTQVAELLDRDPASVRRSKSTGDLYALSARSGRATLFPSWQFDNGRAVPGLREVIPVFPRSFHPMSIQRFMTTENGDLDGLTPVQWLLSGGPTDRVVELVDALGYE